MATYQKRGERWRAIVRKSGHRALSKTFSTKTLARRWATEQERDIESAAFVDPKKLQSITVGYLVDRFIDEFEPKDSKLYSLRILKKGLGHLHLVELTPSDVVAYCKRRTSRDKVAPPTLTQDLGYLREVLTTTRTYWQIPYNGDPVGDARPVLNKLHLIGRSRERSRRPTQGELQRLRDHWNAKPLMQIPMVDIMEFAVASAWRLGEICRVQWADLDTDARTIVIRDRKDPRIKFDNDQTVPVFDPMMAIIKRQPRTDAAVFPYKTLSISTAFTKACQRLGIEDLRFHDLRHEGTSQLFERGYQIQEVALCTGHKDWKMLARYTQLQAKDLHR
jgi:integrase